eukprot:864936-Amphidinium_carterae.1
MHDASNVSCPCGSGCLSDANPRVQYAEISAPEGKRTSVIAGHVARPGETQKRRRTPRIDHG